MLFWKTLNVSPVINKKVGQKSKKTKKEKGKEKKRLEEKNTPKKLKKHMVHRHGY